MGEKKKRFWQLSRGSLEALRQQGFFYTFVIKPVKFLVVEMSLVPSSIAVGYDPKSRRSMLVGPPLGAN